MRTFKFSKGKFSKSYGYPSDSISSVIARGISKINHSVSGGSGSSGKIDEPRNFADWYINFSNPFYVGAHAVENQITTGLQKIRDNRNKNSGLGIYDFFQRLLSVPDSSRRRPSGSGLSSGSSPIPSAVPDYLNADLARHYGMDASTAYMEALANTAHQREVKDLVAAGLNPVLSTRYGGSSGVSGASVYAPAEEIIPVGSSSAKGVSSSSVIADLASGVVGLVTGSSAKSNATRNIVNALGGVLENALSRE